MVGLFFMAMTYQPTKEHLDQQIPTACKSINTILKQLKQDTRADDLFVARMLEGLSRQWAPNVKHEGFGFR